MGAKLWRANKWGVTEAGGEKWVSTALYCLVGRAGKNNPLAGGGPLPTFKTFKLCGRCGLNYRRGEKRKHSSRAGAGGDRMTTQTKKFAKATQIFILGGFEPAPGIPSPCWGLKDRGGDVPRTVYHAKFTRGGDRTVRLKQGGFCLAGGWGGGNYAASAEPKWLAIYVFHFGLAQGSGLDFCWKKKGRIFGGGWGWVKNPKNRGKVRQQLDKGRGGPHRFRECRRCGRIKEKSEKKNLCKKANVSRGASEGCGEE